MCSQSENVAQVQQLLVTQHLQLHHVKHKHPRIMGGRCPRLETAQNEKETLAGLVVVNIFSNYFQGSDFSIGTN